MANSEEKRLLPKTVQIIEMARQTALAMGTEAYLGMLQLIAKKFPAEVKANANCRLRTFSANTPSKFVTRTAFVNVMSLLHNDFQIQPLDSMAM